MSKIVKISDIKEPQSYLYDARMMVYCYVLYIEPRIGKGPFRLFITDFSTNNCVYNGYSNIQVMEAFDLSPDQMFQVDVYDERMKEFLLSYSRVKGEVLNIPAGESVNLSELGIIALIHFKPKMYNNSLEGKAIEIEVLNKNYISNNSSSPKLNDLCREISNKFPKDKKKILTTILPLQFYDLNLLKEDEVPPDNSQLYRSSQIQVENTVNNISTGYGKGFYVKDEVNEMVPGNAYLDDMVDDPDNSSHSFDNARILPGQSRKRDETSSLGIYSDNSFTVEDICKMDLTVDNMVYPITAILMDTIPSDLSHLIVKCCEMVHGKLKLSDPILRPLEMIFCSHPATFLNNMNSLRVFIEPEQFLDLLDTPIELLYAKPELIQQKLESIKRKKSQYNIYKKKIVLGDSSIVIWCTK